MNKTNKLIYFFVCVLFFVLVNFYSTNLICQNVLAGWEYSTPLFNIVFVKNTGAAFSILQNSTGLLITISVISLLAMLYVVWKNFENILTRDIFFISILTSGILGNLFERVFLGYVRDFFELTFIDFPIFNISDIFINLGVFAIIILLLISKKQIRIL